MNSKKGKCVPFSWFLNENMFLFCDAEKKCDHHLTSLKWPCIKLLLAASVFYS